MSMERSPFRYFVTAGYSDAFDGRQVRPSALMRYMEEAAADHCRAIGRDVFSLLESGEGWVLTGGGMTVYRYPDYNEQFMVETWISRWRTLSGIREYRLTTADGDVLCEAGGRWVYWDIGSRRPMPIPDDFMRRWHRSDDSPYRRLFPSSAIPDFPPPVPGEPDESRVTLSVRRGEVDLYGHLHNTIYMDWLMEAVPDHVYRDRKPRFLGLRFFGEARQGDEVSFTTRRTALGRLHEVRRTADGGLLARGYSEWADRDRRMSA